ncbi:MULTISPECIES: hypothetical protein [Brevundimonas]|uniref:hypothetical protein n=1 Tax=Brevundimonas TaxID=41275 RepID=UPI0009E38251|nr:hypothetical protein [Brevundimonas huaxiensis]
MTRSGADQRFMCSWRRDRGKLSCTTLERSRAPRLKRASRDQEPTADAGTRGAHRRRGEARRRE